MDFEIKKGVDEYGNDILDCYEPDTDGLINAFANIVGAKYTREFSKKFKAEEKRELLHFAKAIIADVLLDMDSLNENILEDYAEVLRAELTDYFNDLYQTGIIQIW